MRLILCAALTLCLCLPVVADTTPWMSENALRQFVKTQMNGRKAYATGIECRAKNGTPELRLITQAFGAGAPPFHRWQWVHARTDRLPATVSKLRLSSRPELKYRVVSKHNYTHQSRSYTCAVLFR